MGREYGNWLITIQQRETCKSEKFVVDNEERKILREE